MLTTGERIFRGRRNDQEDWYIVDPATSDPAESIRRWRARYAPTNSPLPRRIVAWVAGWTTFLVITIGPIALAISLIPQLFAALTVIIGVVSFVVGVAGGAFLFEVILPTSRPAGKRLLDVIQIESEVLEWGTGASSVLDVWELNRALRRVRDVTSAYNHWGIDSDFEGERRPDRVIEETIEPTLRAQFAEARAKLLDVSARLGFTPPEPTVADLEPMSRYAE